MTATRESERPRMQAEAFKKAEGPSNSVEQTRPTVGQIWSQWLAGTLRTLPGVLADVWRDGFHAGVSRCADRERELREQIDALNREADELWFNWKNPQAVREQTAQTIALMDAAQGRENDARRRAALDRMQVADPLGYQRAAWLGLTDRAAYAEALKPWMVPA